MELILKRSYDDHQSTIGHLFVEGVLFCGTLEDSFRHTKVAGKTRIPAGRYQVELRRSSPMAERYRSRFGTNGMLWLKDVPGFEYVYLHIGNFEEDTAGCILVGSLIQREIKDGRSSQRVLDSTSTYLDLWSKIGPEIEMGRPVWITVLDE